MKPFVCNYEIEFKIIFFFHIFSGFIESTVIGEGALQTFRDNQKISFNNKLKCSGPKMEP